MMARKELSAAVSKARETALVGQDVGQKEEMLVSRSASTIFDIVEL